MEFVSIDKWELIFTWVNLLILFFIMKKLLFGPITEVMARREAQINKMYNDAEATQALAENMKADYEKKLSDARERASLIVKDAEARARVEEERTLAAARDEAAALKKKAEAQIEKERANAVNGAKNDIAMLALSAAQKIIERDITESDNERLIEEFISSGEENEG